MIEQYQTKQIKQNTIQCVSVVVERDVSEVVVCIVEDDEIDEMQMLDEIDVDDVVEVSVDVIDEIDRLKDERDDDDEQRYTNVIQVMLVVVVHEAIEIDSIDEIDEIERHDVVIHNIQWLEVLDDDDEVDILQETVEIDEIEIRISAHTKWRDGIHLDIDEIDETLEFSEDDEIDESEKIENQVHIVQVSNVQNDDESDETDETDSNDEMVEIESHHVVCAVLLLDEHADEIDECELHVDEMVVMYVSIYVRMWRIVKHIQKREIDEMQSRICML